MIDRKWAQCGLAILVVAALAMTGCSRSPSRIHPPSIDANAAGRQAVSQYDLDGDGRISGDELERAPALKAALARLDTDGDGAVTADDVTARVRAWQESRVGRMSAAMTILANGRPLEGAIVTLDPEEFLGPNIQPATGLTEPDGMVMPSIEVRGNEPPGVAPGFYLVRVTKMGMNIPARYNTETTLGIELAQDAIELEEGITFHLQLQ